MVVRTLEQAITNPAQDDGGAQSILGTLIALKLSLVSPPEGERPAPQTLRDQIAAEYVHQVALSIPRRTGTARIDAACNVLGEMARMGRTAGPDFDTAREALITHFDEVTGYEWLLNSYGQYLQDARLVPWLHRVLENTSSGMRAAALIQLAKLAPDEVDKYVVREACALLPIPFPFVRDISSAEVLPEVDSCLKEKLRVQILGGQRIVIGTTLQYIARFADAALVPEVRAAYLAQKDWLPDARGAAVAYLMRWAPEESLPLLEEQLSEQNRAWGLISFLQAVRPPRGDLQAVLRQQLKTASSKSAGRYASALAWIGTLEDEQFLRDELEQLRHKRSASGFTADEGTFEKELVSAILHWKSTQKETEALVRTCVSVQCKQGFSTQ